MQGRARAKVGEGWRRASTHQGGTISAGVDRLQLELRVKEVGADRVQGVVEDRVVLRRVDARRWRNRGLEVREGKVVEHILARCKVERCCSIICWRDECGGGGHGAESGCGHSVCGAARGSQK